MVKCHKTHADAVAHLGALMANVDGAKMKAHYRTKSIMDAPNLRGDDSQRCLNCQYAQPIVTDDTAWNESAGKDVTMMEADIMLVCTKHDFGTEPSAVCDSWEAVAPSVVVEKEASGKYRWIAFTSSSYQDKDTEIVSQKALEADAERMNASGDYGTLDWHHTPIILGDCDASFMHGHISIESGTFRDNWVGERFATMKGLGMSRTFYNPANEPDAEGVYHNIRTFSRAILPAERASNRLTMLDVSAKEKKMSLLDKAKALVDKLGGTPEAEAKVKELLAAAEVVDKAAKGKLQQKEVTAKDARTDLEDEVGALKENPAAAEVAKGKDIAALTDAELQSLVDEMKAASAPVAESKEKAWFVGDMTPDEFDTRIGKAVAEYLAPAVKEIAAQITAATAMQAKTMKEANDTISAGIAKTQMANIELLARIAALEGLTPRKYIASLAQDNIISTEKAATLKPAEDANKPKWIGSEIAEMLSGKGAPVAPPPQ